jgi:SnoaL-like domain
MPEFGQPHTPERAASHRAIENLIITYTHLVDAADFAGLDTLLADATFAGSGAPISGLGVIETMFRETIIVYEDGTPRTKHLASNIIIDLDDAGDSATALSYVTILQAPPGIPLQTIAAGRYHDSFERHDGRWRFTERRVSIDLIGDLSRHLNGAPSPH